jgi:hypothetical protein
MAVRWRSPGSNGNQGLLPRLTIRVPRRHRGLPIMPVVAAGHPALLRCILLERGSYAASASLRIGAEHMRCQRVRDMRGQVAVLGQHRAARASPCSAADLCHQPSSRGAWYAILTWQLTVIGRTSLSAAK